MPNAASRRNRFFRFPFRQAVLPALLAGLVLAAGAAVAGAGSAAASWRWDRVAGISLALIGPSGEVWRFHYGRDLDHAYFHPLATIEGRALTADRPPDHIWHHGLWFSWKYINGVNYWEVAAETGHPAGRTSWKVRSIRTRRDGSARIAIDLDYRPAGAVELILTERRIIEISAPDAAGVYALDWTGEFLAVRDAVLDRTPMPGEPRGQINGGYAGLALRLSTALKDPLLASETGPAVEWRNDRYRGRHAGLDFSGLTDGHPAGIAVLDHPANPRSPAAWYAVRSAAMSFFNPALLSAAPLPLRAGERMTLRYRILAHPGRWDAARLKAEAARFARAG